MTEDFLQYIWQHSLYLPDGNMTTEGETVKPLQPGQPNIHAGPDFTDARVHIGDTLWAGCVEIHLRSSDWERHGHHTDPAYNNVVLHVVYQHDADTYNARRQKIPVMELHFDARYYDNYNRLADSKARIACHDDVNKVDEFSLASWLERLAIERLEQKAGAIMQTYAVTGSNWEETLYRRLARNFGFSLNALPFESLAKSLPLNILLKHRDHLQQVEALLFGQAGMLADENITDAYYLELRKEYLYQQKKFNLEPVDRFLWKFLRLRPINFSTLRIAQFAALIHRNDHLFSQVIEAKSIDTFEKLFDLQASAYWDTHYVFGKDSLKRNKVFGKTAVRTILINTVVPFLFVYGKTRGKDEFCTRAVDLLRSLPSEKNSILTQWEELGVHNSDAFVSQALLQLTNEYCQPKRCLSCAIGNKIVKSPSPRPPHKGGSPCAVHNPGGEHALSPWERGSGREAFIRIQQTTSTNWHLLQLSNAEKLPEGTVVVTDSQTQGRGQGENSWESEPSANLTFSIILYPKSVKASRQFILSKAISLAVYDFVSQFVPGASVKWPNDVYVGDRKITGMLIENFIEGAYINKTIAGIGVNINQEHFLSDAPNPVSLRQLTGKTYQLDDCLQNLHTHIVNRYRMITGNTSKLNSDYLRHLYRFGQQSRFSANGIPFEATITGVNHYGMLEMTTNGDERKIFGFKEVVFE